MAFQNCPFEVTPYDESNIIKTPELVNLNYTNQDFWSLKTRLVEFIKEKFGETFTDFVESDLAIMLIENWAFIADTLSFKMDQIANEIFIDTVSELDNAFRLAQLVGFKPLPPIAARSLWSASINSTLETDLLIPGGQRIDFGTELGSRSMELYPANANNQPIFDEDIIIPAGLSLNTTIVGIEGKTRTDAFTATGEPNQANALGSPSVIYNSVRVYVDGEEWEQVQWFTDSKKRKEFRVEFSPDWKAFIMFGSARAGQIPARGAEISVTYRIGGGIAGNITTGSLEFQRTFIVPGFDFRIPVTFINYTRGEHGYEGDTIEDIKFKLPRWMRLQHRAVTGDDYKTLADQFVTPYTGQIGKSTAVLRNHGCAANVIDLYVLAKDGNDDLALASNELKVLLQEEVDSKKMITDYVCIRDGVILEVDVSVDLLMNKFYKKFEEEYRDRVTRRLDTFFSLNNWEYNKDLKAGDLIKEISDVKEVKSVILNFLTEDEENSGELVVAKFFEIIRPKTLEINFIYE